MPVNDNSKIVRFDGASRLDWSVAEVLRLAGEKELNDIIVIGRKPDGTIWFDHTQAQQMEVNWVLDQVKLSVLDRD